MQNQPAIENTQLLQPLKRTFLPKDFELKDWDDVKNFFEDLTTRELKSLEELEQWLRDVSELEAVLGEDAAWRQIRVTTDTTNEDFEKAFTYFVSEIEPKIKPYAFELNKKLMASPFVKELPKEQYFPYLRSVENSIALYREENIPLQAELNLLAQQYGMISGKMTVEIDGQEMTLQQAARLLQGTDRAKRQVVFEKIAQRRLQDKEELNTLFDKLLALRHQVALNAGFKNYRDYKFKELGRFDYTISDCEAFHEAIKKHILPLHRRLVAHKKKELGLETLRPWDTDATPAYQQPLVPFTTGRELTDKAISAFEKLDPYFSNCVKQIDAQHRLDLDSRVGKAPGGYNCPLPETGIPFIFMNAAGSINDVITMMHEGGHAFHSFLAHPLPLSAMKEYPMEMAELASMSMELFSMEYWQSFFPDEKDLQRAKYEELDRIISVLPWIAVIDKFQHWLYTNPGHNIAEREIQWMSILKEYDTGLVNWEEWEHYRAHAWQKQLHLFEVPFYYIEYGIAQLGAIAMWQQYRGNPQTAIANYKAALSQGYTKTLSQLYEIAGIRFDLSPTYVADLSDFLNERLNEVGV